MITLHKVDAKAHEYEVGQLPIGDTFILNNEVHLKIAGEKSGYSFNLRKNLTSELTPETHVHRCEAVLTYNLVYRYENA